MKTRVIQCTGSVVLGGASFWLILEGGIVGLVAIPLILIGLAKAASLRALRIGVYLASLGLTGAGLMSISSVTTAHCPPDGSVPTGGCVEDRDLLILVFIAVAFIGMTLLAVAALRRRNQSTLRLPNRAA